MDPIATTLAGWVIAHEWTPVIAVAALLVVRLLQKDARLPGELPAWARPYATLLLSWAGAQLAAYLGHAGGAAVASHAAVSFGIATLAQHAAATAWGDLPLPGFLRRAPAPAEPKPAP